MCRIIRHSCFREMPLTFYWNLAPTEPSSGRGLYRCSCFVNYNMSTGVLWIGASNLLSYCTKCLLFHQHRQRNHCLDCRISKLLLKICNSASHNCNNKIYFFAHDEVNVHCSPAKEVFFHNSQLDNERLLEKSQNPTEIRTCSLPIARHKRWPLCHRDVIEKSWTVEYIRMWLNMYDLYIYNVELPLIYIQRRAIFNIYTT